VNAGVICVYLNGPNPDIKIEAGKASIISCKETITQNVKEECNLVCKVEKMIRFL